MSDAEFQITPPICQNPAQVNPRNGRIVAEMVSAALAQSNRLIAELHCQRGFTQRLENDFNNALEALNIAIRLYPEFAGAYAQRGNVFFELGRHREAIADYNTALGICPQDARLHHNRGSAFARCGAYDEAIQDYTEAIHLGLGDRECYLNRCSAYADKGDRDKARADYVKSEHCDGNSHFNFHYVKDDYDQAIKRYDEAIQLSPQTAELYRKRGCTYYKTGNVDQAIGDFTVAIQLDCSDFFSFAFRGMLHEKNSAYARAIADWTEADRLNRNFPFSRQKLDEYQNELFVVTDPGPTPLDLGQQLTSFDLIDAIEQYGEDAFSVAVDEAA
ncbi:MAG: tetratricopeptide repeat protein [Verrucomicrobiaceae bacterium]|nr:tetratricopeptide repeat protein [Verrucomicrobiaceae bacterium]